MNLEKKKKIEGGQEREREWGRCQGGGPQDCTARTTSGKGKVKGERPKGKKKSNIRDSGLIDIRQQQVHRGQAREASRNLGRMRATQ